MDVVQYNHLPVAHPDNPKTHAICGAKRTNKDAICKQPAGYRTSHLGEGRCYLHGGSSPTGVKAGRYKHGRRAYRTIERIEAALGADVERSPQDLQPELNTQRAMLELHLRALEIKLDLADGEKTEEKIISASHEDDDNMVGDGGVAQIDEQGILDDHPRAEFSITDDLSLPLPTQLTIEELLEAIRLWSNDIVKTSATINKMEREDAVTRAELIHIRIQMEAALDKFIPDRDTIRSILEFMSKNAGMKKLEDGEEG